MSNSLDNRVADETHPVFLKTPKPIKVTDEFTLSDANLQLGEASLTNSQCFRARNNLLHFIQIFLGCMETRNDTGVSEDAMIRRARIHELQ